MQLASSFMWCQAFRVSSLESSEKCPLTLSLKERHCYCQVVLCVLSVPSVWRPAFSVFLRTCLAPSMTSPRERKQPWAQQSVRPALRAARGIRATRLSLLSPHTHPPISPASLGGHRLLLLALLWEATNLGLVRFPLQVFQVLSSLIICCPILGPSVVPSHLPVWSQAWPQQPLSLFAFLVALSPSFTTQIWLITQ